MKKYENQLQSEYPDTWKSIRLFGVNLSILHPCIFQLRQEFLFKYRPGLQVVLKNAFKSLRVLLQHPLDLLAPK